MTDIEQLIANLGFPIVVCLYLLLRLEKKIDSILEELHRIEWGIIKKEEKEN